MVRILLASLLAALGFTVTGCAASPGEQTVLIIGVGFVRIRPPADGARFELLGVAAVIHPAFSGVAAGAVAHQSVAVGFD